ncbi:MAG TPA: hypothetical protein VFF76_01965 [Holophagaceae bacterium]|jgi:hypothetical protein|nr:hypothetical protein [Holophagaceae bacterium]
MNGPMHEEMIPLPESCARALAALQADALEPGLEAEAHLRICAACAEARVLLLAQEDEPLPLAPAGYFESLPARIARKLPAARTRRSLPGWVWAAAAGILMAAGVGGYLAGRATPAPPVLQPMAQQTVQPADPGGQDRALPFHDRDEDLAELGSLSPSEMKELVSSLDKSKVDAPAPERGHK